jgi:hypothetical protein
LGTAFFCVSLKISKIPTLFIIGRGDLEEGSRSPRYALSFENSSGFVVSSTEEH